jgi:trimethyllysine dioxygenase
VRPPSVLINPLGGFYDFTADLASKDTAYTSLALHAHTDTTYFSDPAGLQMFHLLSHTDGSGGESLLVDGFAAARILQREAKRSFEVLSRKKLRSHASGNEGISIQPFVPHPVFTCWGAELYQIRWNTDDRATMDRWRDDKSLEEWYEAAWKWCEILRRPSVEYREKLRPGRPLSAFTQMSWASSSIADNLLVFDNWRVLHGRSAFTGKRRICGGYSTLCKHLQNELIRMLT